MTKKFYFLSGLPRSGNTVLSALLEQHPSIHVGPLSYAQDLLKVMYKCVFQFDNFLLSRDTKSFFNISKNLLNHYYEDIEEPIILDRHKSVGTPEFLGRLEKNLPYEPKIIFTYRPILEVLASYINLANQDPAPINWLDKQLERDYLDYQAKDLNVARCDWLMRPLGQLDTGIISMTNLLKKENCHKVLFISYENIINDTQNVLNRIYEFLEIEPFNNNLIDIQKQNKDFDLDINMPENTHYVKKKLSPPEYDLTKLLPQVIIDRYKNYDLLKEG